jgi:putative FmdB family regulatory protein
MPIYEYRCAACGFQSEYLRKVSDPNLSVCPECGKDTFKKLLTAAGFQLKGSGWYATDFKHSGAKPAAAKPDAESKKDADTKKSAEAKPDGESKSAAGAKPAEAAPAAGGSGGAPAS